MTVNHKDLTGASLHEPKGVASASAHNVYVANGSGSGTWEKVDKDAINTSSIKNLNQIVLTTDFNDIDSAHSHWVVCPLAGNITKIYTVIHQALAGSDTTISAKIGSTLVTNGVATITQSGSAIGDVDVATPSGNNTVTAGQAIELISNGGTSTSNAMATVTLLMDVS
tara:strand:- start:476 stop:979 length:504 start_codon:yes stop_codon:yes gene_type:complete